MKRVRPADLMRSAEGRQIGSIGDEASVDKSVDKSLDKSVDKSVDDPVDDSVDDPANNLGLLAASCSGASGFCIVMVVRCYWR